MSNLEMVEGIEFKSPHPKTWVFDLDGTLMEYNNALRDEPDALLPGVKEMLDSIKDDFIILVSARPKRLIPETEVFLKRNGIRYDQLILGLPRGERILVNDKKPDVDVTAIALNVERDEGFE